MARSRIVILGAAGRDFHDFNVLYRDDPSVEVVAFTAAQIPDIEKRVYPRELAGERYPDGIPIRPEAELDELVRRQRIDQVVFAYSDVSHRHVMHLASRAVAAGADFRLIAAERTMLRSTRPVVSVCAVRTGCGKSPASRRIAAILRARGMKAAVVRHPMPYGDLARQAVQRFASRDDLDDARCTIEEREEYEPHIDAGHVVFAGVDYERVLRAAEAEADVVLWDGGNNDTPFILPDLEIVLVDPQRAGHERDYFPGEVNLLRAHVVLIAKMDSAPPEGIERVWTAVQAANPGASVVESEMPLTADHPERIRDRRVLVIEDGPTLTHGGMSFGAGALAARGYHARETIDPRPFAVGSLAKVFEEYPHIGNVLPAMGYGEAQIAELAETIDRADCDTVIVATPADLRRVVRIRKPTCRVRYELRETGRPNLEDALEPVLAKVRLPACG